jgi:spore coat polysaccharide biosynthesis protein SpsF
MRNFWAILACRNNGSRLYGKPLQNLDEGNRFTILDNIIRSLKKVNCLDGIALAISTGVENDIFEEYSIANSLQFVRGDEQDVLGRLVQAAKHVGATDIFRVTTESPFLFTEEINLAWQQHQGQKNDATFLDDIIDGCGFEIISTEALKISHDMGDGNHRSELCTLYIRQNKSSFKIGYVRCPEELMRPDIRLTVDNPEDLILCRKIYSEFNGDIPNFNLFQIVKYLDKNPHLIQLTLKYCPKGMESMYL